MVSFKELVVFIIHFSGVLLLKMVTENKKIVFDAKLVKQYLLEEYKFIDDFMSKYYIKNQGHEETSKYQSFLFKLFSVNLPNSTSPSCNYWNNFCSVYYAVVI